MKPQFELTLLGTFLLTVDGDPVAGLTSEKMQALLAYLAVEQTQSHSREAIAEMLWPDRPEGVARQNLRQALSRLQRALPAGGEPLLIVNRREVHFNTSCDVEIDYQHFVSIVAQVRRHPHENVAACTACCHLLTTAVDLYQGEFLTALYCDSPAFDEWRLLKAEWLRREVLQALDTLLQQAETAQHWVDAYRFAWRSVEIDPLREVAHQQVMRALAHSGRRTEALAQYDTLAHLLRQELDVAPSSASTALFEAIRDHQIAQIGTPTDSHAHSQTSLPATAPPAIPHNLPIQHIPFVGRQQELARIADRLVLPECHLLTLVGPGGAGKTRLALEVATRQLQSPQRRFPEGVYFVALATVKDDEQLLAAVAAALDYRFPDKARSSGERQSALVHYLHDKRLLLLLDNYEQLTDTMTLILAILSQAPTVQLLVTSRIPLQLRAEWLIDVIGLAHPDAADLMAQETQEVPKGLASRSLATFEAVQFFTGLHNVCWRTSHFRISCWRRLAI
ncbi:MAG: BTAD domain-containing putative transcriptional regulator [Caldilineaceae bacterium]